MKLYKYRKFSEPEQGLARLQLLLRDRAFWCARPDALNDPEEFGWTCDFSASPDTVCLLTEQLVRTKGRSRDEARSRVVHALGHGSLRALAEPVVASMIQQCRNEIGLACFGSSADNDTLWKRYGEDGDGVCLEVEAPDRLLGTQLHYVRYWDSKRVHVDTFLRSASEPAAAQELYDISLLTKASSWEPEAEIRFVSKRQNANVVIDGSVVTRLILGDALNPRIREAILRFAGATPVTVRG